MTPTEAKIKVVCASCKAHISGPVDAAPHFISHGICLSCLKTNHPKAYFFGRRRALAERLASMDQTGGIAYLNGFFFVRGSR